MAGLCDRVIGIIYHWTYVYFTNTYYETVQFISRVLVPTLFITLLASILNLVIYKENVEYACYLEVQLVRYVP